MHIEVEVAQDCWEELVEFCCGYVAAYAYLDLCQGEDEAEREGGDRGGRGKAEGKAEERVGCSQA